MPLLHHLHILGIIGKSMCFGIDVLKSEEEVYWLIAAAMNGLCARLAGLPGPLTDMSGSFASAMNGLRPGPCRGRKFSP